MSAHTDTAALDGSIAEAVDVVAVLRSQIDTARALSSDAFYAQELPKLEAAYTAVNELIGQADNVLWMVECGLIPYCRDLAAALANVRPQP